MLNTPFSFLKNHFFPLWNPLASGGGLSLSALLGGILIVWLVPIPTGENALFIAAGLFCLSIACFAFAHFSTKTKEKKNDEEN